MPDISKTAQLWGELYAMLCKKTELRNALGSISESELARLDDLAERIIEKYLMRG